MTHLVRDATEADLAVITSIYNDVVRTSAAVYKEQEVTLDDRRAWYAQRIGQGYPVLVAEDPADETVLGFATFGDFRPWPGYRHTVEHSVYLRGDARRRGLGQALVGKLLDRAAILGKHVMIAGVKSRLAPLARAPRLRTGRDVARGRRQVRTLARPGADAAHPR